MADEHCGEHFARHPSQPHLVAVCALPQGHDGDHDNRLPKPPYSVLRSRSEPSGEEATDG